MNPALSTHYLFLYVYDWYEDMEKQLIPYLS